MNTLTEWSDLLIRSVKRACDILSCFTVDTPTLGNAEIADMLGLSRSTTHHLISTLYGEGVLMKEGKTKYRLGWRILEWNNQVMFQQEFYNIAMPIVKEIVDEFEGTVHIGMFDKGDVVFVLRMSSEETFIPTFLGARKPAYCTSSGKVLLAHNKDYLRETINKGLHKQGPNTITDITKLKREVKQVIDTGYAFSVDENDDGTYALAAPIFSYSGEVIAAVNLVGQKNYMGNVDQSKLIQKVIQTAKKVSRSLGYIEFE